ncbi:MAG: cytochrome c biogenesis protein CcdA [Aphanocapsa feldmannii 277cV]|uniref:Cytochrome c biogenesis protein CcdA n=2 Tax=Aphanocapsa feldmannii TaxID=192050 RepID=A0A524RMY7_9CHRO|nr:MAG: cytochrome c biogenesis protein CcdA [Aphanocapsa feldmannii 288cV]TGG91063.1 MAG: cytochrome c biogenesis protein CcdA [Aphanocapsa feldmannii 277cV]TGH21940.1 MAG: cytochrome c biogenesis protein CcdA [Aphanocapsa feldmannii 277cI]
MLFPLVEWAHGVDHLLRQSLIAPGPLSVALVLGAGLLTSLGPCALSLLPVTLAYLAGFGDENHHPLGRSLSFAGGIVLALTLLGMASALLGRIYGQVPNLVPLLVSLLALVMGLNLLGLLRVSLPAGPSPERFTRLLPQALAPLGAGLAFGLAASPCTTPVLAVLLAWISGSGDPLLGALFLGCFALGQVLPLLLAGSLAASLPRLLALRSAGVWIPRASGTALVLIGSFTLLARLP